MTSLIEAAETAARTASCQCSVPCGHAARPVIEAVAAWMDEQVFSVQGYDLRYEIRPPKPTVEDVFRKRCAEQSHNGGRYSASGICLACGTTIRALQDAGLLNEETPNVGH